MHDGADNPAFPCCPCNGLLDLHQRRGNVRGPQFSGLPFYLSVWFSSASVEDGGSAIAISEVFLSHIQYIGSGSEHCVKPCKQKTKKKTQNKNPKKWPSHADSSYATTVTTHSWGSKGGLLPWDEKGNKLEANISNDTTTKNIIYKVDSWFG